MTTKLLAKATKKKPGECCSPECTCACRRKPRKKTEKKVHKYKTSKWLAAFALRPARCLLSSIIEFAGILPQRVIDVFQKYFQKSVKTRYSTKFVKETYLPPLISNKVPDWKQHRKWLDEKAAPKKDFTETMTKSCRVPLNKLSRYKYLSKPRWPRCKFDNKQEIHFNQPITATSKNAMKYEATERTRKLAKALKRFQQNKFNYDYSLPPNASPKALKAKCPVRTAVLAMPRIVPVETTRKETKHGVAESALSYKLTERTAFLAKPRPIYVPRKVNEEDTIVIEDRVLSEYGVSFTALKYRASNKILLLAVPKEPPMAPPPEFPYFERERTKYNVCANALKYKISARLLKLSKPRTSGK